MRRLAALAVVLSLSRAGVADFKVLRTDDTVKLVDGTQVRGTVIAVGMKAVIVAVEDREVVIPRSKVESIVRGPARAETLRFTTDPVDGVKVITGKGFRDKATEGEEGEQTPEEKVEGKRPAPEPTRMKPKKAIDADAIRRFMKQDKRVEGWVKMMGGPEKAAEFAKRMDESALKRMLGNFAKGKN